MKRWKHIFMSTLLVVSMSIPCFAFDDVTSPSLARQIDALQMMGIVNGVSHSDFAPQDTLTRAQFTKMAVVAQGRQKEADRQAGMTIFPDVRSSHWAVGYINLAVRGEDRFMSGFGDGTFGPDKTITYGEAVTILMRLLGYNDEDVGMLWPMGYIQRANSIGLSDDVYLKGNQTISRAQAVQLFSNLLVTEKKDSTQTFAEAIGAQFKREVILLNADVEAENGAMAIDTSSGVFELANGHAPYLIQGMIGTLLLDEKGKAMGFVPDVNNQVIDITIASVTAGSISTTTGREYTVKATIPTCFQGEQVPYGDVFMNLNAGKKVSLHVDLAGNVTRVFVPENITEEAIVVSKDKSELGFVGLANGRNDYQILRHGKIVSASEIRKYDVASYVARDNQIAISTLRLTGSYADAYPNASAPTKVTVMGNEFEVLEDAIGHFSDCRLGNQITLLLTKDHKVAGVLKANQLNTDSIGLASVQGNTVTVKLEEGLTVTGVHENASYYQGEVVSVSSSSDALRLSIIDKKSKSETLYVNERRLGSASLADNVRIYERIGDGPAVAIALADIRDNKVSANQVTYFHHNDAGEVDIVVLDDVTGDRYIYGYAYFKNVKLTNEKMNGKEETRVVSRLYIECGDVTYGPYRANGIASGEVVGVSIDKAGITVSSYAELEWLRIESGSWIDDETIAMNNQQYHVPQDGICYNKTSKRWVSVSVARAYDGNITAYADEHNVIRLIEMSN